MSGASGNPNFSNSISPDSWNQIAAGLRAQQNLNTYAGPGIGSIGASGGFGYPAFGGAFSNPGPGSSAWDPQNTAYNMLFRNQISPQLGAANLSRVSDFVNQSGQFGNPYAGQALAGTAFAESGGGNPFAVNPSSGASGLFQWMNSGPGDYRGTNARTALGGDYSPENQAFVAMSEILGGGYPGVNRTLNNPASTYPQMTGSLINQFEGLSGSPGQAAGDMARAAVYGRGLGSITNSTPALQQLYGYPGH